jgi:hypothetical protein
MGIDRVASPQPVSSHPDPGPRLDRRRLVQGVVAASLAGAAGGMGAGMTARAAGATGDPDVLPRIAASRVPTGDSRACACLEASLHIMMQ